MAPIATASTPTTSILGKTKIEGVIDPAKLAINEAIRQASNDEQAYSHLKLEVRKVDWPVLEKVEIGKDKALLADPDTDFSNLFRNATLVKHLGPRIGTEIVGIKLNNLDEIQKNELALLTARRHVVIFRDQDDFTIDEQIDLLSYFGPLHKHPTASYPNINGKDYEEVVVIRSGFEFKPGDPKWHSDATFEIQPPAYTALKIIEAPSVGSDTHWASGYALYDTLSESLREYLEAHTAIHSDIDLSKSAASFGGYARRPPVYTEHPLVITHPVTGYKSIFVNSNFTKSIVGVPKGESDAILNYLYHLINTVQEHKVRVKWENNTVALWDNRGTFHTGTSDYAPQFRIGTRVTAIGDSPVYDPKGKSEAADIEEKVKKALKEYSLSN